MLGIQFFDELPNNFENDFHLIVDAIFGYSFVSEGGTIRAPFANIIEVFFSI